MQFEFTSDLSRHYEEDKFVRVIIGGLGPVVDLLGDP